jgi:hypothetical protein
MFEKKEPLVIYWAPKSIPGNQSVGEWNMLYKEPETLYQDLVKNKEPESKDMSFFACPAVSNRLKRTYVFRNNLKTICHFDGTDVASPSIQVEQGVGARIIRPTNLKNGICVEFTTKYIFFSETSFEGLIHPPFFHRPKYTEIGTVIPGSFDMSKWFRFFAIEIQTWNPKGTILLEEDEPLFYFEPMTEQKVILKRFVLNEKLWSYAESCANVASYYGRHKSLTERYRLFTETRTHEAVLKEIKQNLI